jgi:hypothetical protein
MDDLSNLTKSKIYLVISKQFDFYPSKNNRITFLGALLSNMIYMIRSDFSIY